MGKIAVTGSKGMIGRHMVALLESENIDCHALARDDWDLSHWKNSDELDTIFANVEAIFHFGAALPQGKIQDASLETQLLFDANVRSCLNLAEWARRREIPLVFLSGATVYENPHGPLIRENDAKVVYGFGGFYGYTKLLAEEVIQHQVKQGLKAIILRPSSVYGCGLGEGKLIQNYLDLALANKKIAINQPNNRINLIHSLDVARAALQSYRAKSWGVYNIAQSYCPSILELAEAAIKVCGGGGIELSGDSVDGFLRFNLDSTRAANDFSFMPSVNLEEGLMLMKLKRLL